MAARAAAASTPTVFYNTSLTQCPTGYRLEYFYYWQDTPDFRGSSWCGAAQADIDWANRSDPVRWRIPYLLESCQPGVSWTYSHAFQDGTRYYSPPYRDIHMVCSELPAAPEPPEPDKNSGTQDGMCVGNPILPVTGEKQQTEIDHVDAGPHPLSLLRSFRSLWVTRSAGGAAANAGLGAGWHHNHAARLSVSASAASVMLGDGSQRSFTLQPGGHWHSSNSADTLSANTRNGGPGYLYRRSDDDSAWQFDAAGKLLTHTQRNGWVMSHAYNAANQLVQVSNHFGRSLQFGYNAAGQLAQVATPDGQLIRYTFDSAPRLTGVSYPGNSSKTYLYENTQYPQALSGIIDENGNRFASFAYDALGRGISTEHAGAANRYQVAYGAQAGDPATVTDPLGTQRSYRYSTILGKPAVASADKPSASGQGDAASRLQNASGLIESETDFLGITTLFTWDATRRLPLSTTRAAGRPETQTSNAQWHPTWRLPVLVTETGRSTAYTYDAGGNPLSEAVTDLASGQTRTWQWTYNLQGLPATLTDPRGGLWRYGYDATGNRVSVKNPLGQETRYDYDAAGRVTKETAPNGLVITYAYDLRGRLTQAHRGGEVTHYAYTPSGQLASVQMPNGYALSYGYDAAQRLIAAQDNRGNRVTYTLDAMGNRIREQAQDANGNIALATSRIVNSLNRVAAIAGAAGQTTQLGFDANGQPVSQTSPLNQTTRQALDALRRPIAATFADNAVASQAWNQLDQLTRASDPKGVATRYAYNAFGEVMSETSPDIGSLSYSRDAAGNVIGQTDARGQSTAITRDALGRPTEIRYGSDHVVTLSHDSNQAGYLAKVEDGSGSTAYERDSFGRVLSKTQVVHDNPGSPSLLRLSYGHTRGDLSNIGHPSGLKVFYKRTHGRITQIDVQEPGRDKPVVPFVSNLTHTALGQPKSWNWSSGDSASRSFDADARMTANEFASYQYDAASRITGIAQSLWARRPGAHGASELYQIALSWRAGYDNRDRLVSFARDGAESKYSYDPNSNRLTAIDKTTSDTDLDGSFDADDLQTSSSQSLNIEATSNRLLGLTQTVTTTRHGKTMSVVTTPIHYTLDANGSLTSDGLRGFDYDAANRLSKVRLDKEGEASSIRYLHNALGQRVFKSEPAADSDAPSEAELGADFIGWLKKRFGWLFAQAQANTSIGTAYVYGDGEIPEWAILGEYDNGSAKGKGRTEYIWLPTNDGNAIPIGMYRGSQFYAIHPDHLGTPRLITNEDNKPVWQWPYSAFGNNKPTGILKAT
ncbi:MAG: DUF6531 domain-containing protein, partial [Burkholderiaceae bacterium]